VIGNRHPDGAGTTRARPNPALTRTGHPTPWSREPTRELQVPRARVTDIRGRATAPVFVDDSGRRHRWGRKLAAAIGGMALAYLIVTVLALAGAPGVGRLAPPGIDRLTRPSAGGGGDVAVGPDAREAPLPPAAVAPSGPSTGGESSSAGSGDTIGSTGQPDPVTTGDAASTTSTSTTTTTPTPGNGSTTSVPAPSSTVPDRTRPTGGGPPDTPPGQQ
jgi:hypothetical protein